MHTFAIFDGTCVQVPEVVSERVSNDSENVKTLDATEKGAFEAGNLLLPCLLEK